MIERIGTSAKTLNMMVGDLLDASRLESKNLALSLEPTDVPKFVEELVDKTKEDSPHNRVIVRSQGEPTVAPVDPTRFEQIPSNLVSNAVKYGDPATDIDVEVSCRPDEIEVTVTNSGRGLTEAERERLFTRFYRGESAGAVSGLGLGLYICRGLVEAHGGRMWVESKPGAT